MDIYAGLADCATGACKIKKSKYPSKIAKIHNKGNFVV